MTQSAAYSTPSKEESSRVRGETRGTRSARTVVAEPPSVREPEDSATRLERDVASRGWGILDAIAD
jgi:hypothetical protein